MRFPLSISTLSTSHPHPLCRSSRSKMPFKIGVLRKVANFTGKHLGWSLFLIKLHAWRPVTLLKKTPTQVFSCKICEVFKQTAGGCFYLCCFSWMFLLLLVPCRSSTTSLQYCYFLRLKKHFLIYITTTTSLIS